MRSVTITLWLMSALVLKAAESPPSSAIQRWIGELGAAKYAEREAAQTGLLKQGAEQPEAVLEECVQAYARTRDPEVEYRLRAVLAQLVDTHLFDRPKGYLGIQFNPRLVPGPDGALQSVIEIVSVVPDSVAEKAGLLAGDQIVQVDGQALPQDEATKAFVSNIQSRRPATQVQLRIRRGEEFRDVDLELGEMPEDVRKKLATPEARKEYFDNWLRINLARVRQAQK